jgi:TfoX/Sxy family transcriptional regulator of competence genes
MEIPKPSDADAAYFRSIVPDDPAVQVKPMFGNLGAFVNGNMFMGLFGSTIGLRLPSDDAAELLEIEGAGPFGPTERPMGGYVSLPTSFREDPRTSGWVARALEHVRAMPAKAPKKR